MLASLASNYMVDYLTPVVFDGRAHVVDLPSGDPRLKLEQILAWEFNNLLDLFERASQQMLLPLQAFFARADARDQLGRLVQYALLMAQGLLATLTPSEAKKALAARIKEVVKPVSDFRRTGRWGKEVKPVLALRDQAHAAWAKGVTVAMLPAAASKISHISHLMLDRKVWLMKVRLLSGTESVTQRRSLRALAFTHAFGFLQLCLKTGRTDEAQLWLRGVARRLLSGCTRADDADGAASDMSPELLQGLKDCVRELLLLVQALHQAHMVRTHDALVGALGVCTGVYDVRRQWLSVARAKAN